MLATARHKSFISSIPTSIRICVIASLAVLLVGTTFRILLPHYRLDFWNPHFSCADQTYDFGSGQAGKLVRRDFVVTNSGRGKLKVLGIAGGCSCLSATSAALDLGSGESGTVTAVLSLQGLHGPIARTLQVMTNDPDVPVARLNLRGNVTTTYEVSRYSIPLEFSGTAQSEAVVFVSNKVGEKPFQIIKTEAVPAIVDIDTKKIDESAYKLVLQLKKRSIGKTRCRIRVETDKSNESEFFLDAIVNEESTQPPRSNSKVLTSTY